MNLTPNELRIGSLIDWDGEICTITGMYESNHSLPTSFLIRTNLGETIIERIKPIRLTDEIYRKLGGNFRIDEGWITTDDNGGIYCCDDNDQMVFCPPCEFVHQLQMLFFSLTGQELIFTHP